MDAGYVEISDGLFSWGNSRADKSAADGAASYGKGGKGKKDKRNAKGKNGKGTAGKGTSMEEATIKEQKDEKPALEVLTRDTIHSRQSGAAVDHVHPTCMRSTLLCGEHTSTSLP